MDVGGLGSALRAIAPSGVRTGVRAITTGAPADLPVAERAIVAGAVPQRQLEFIAGRTLLRELTGTADAILVGPDRAPVLPVGVVGSLAHDHTVAVAALTRCPGIRALGIDVEPDEPLEPAIAAVILNTEELHLDPHLAFTLKEAAYKAWSTCGGRLLEHHELRLHVRDGEFTAVVLHAGVDVPGRFVTFDGRHLALAVL